MCLCSSSLPALQPKANSLDCSQAHVSALQQQTQVSLASMTLHPAAFWQTLMLSVLPGTSPLKKGFFLQSLSCQPSSPGHRPRGHAPEHRGSDQYIMALCVMYRLQSQMTMLVMRCRVLQNELSEGQQEQGAAEADMASLQHALQQHTAQQDMATKR